MFEFLMDMGNYESRVVGRYEDGDDKMVSTARVSDGRRPYETAFLHPGYNEGKMVIVEAYSTKAEAEVGHERWETIMQSGPLPSKLVDCCNSGVGDLYEKLGGEVEYPRTI